MVLAKFTYQVIQAVTFSSPSWRSLNHSKGSRFHHPEKVTKNCQVDDPTWSFMIIYRHNYQSQWDVAITELQVPHQTLKVFFFAAKISPILHETSTKKGETCYRKKATSSRGWVAKVSNSTVCHTESLWKVYLASCDRKLWKSKIIQLNSPDKTADK